MLRLCSIMRFKSISPNLNYMKSSETRSLPLRINELQQRVKTLKKSFGNGLTCENQMPTLFNTLHDTDNDKETVNKQKQKTYSLKRILLPNTTDNIDSVINSEDTNRIEQTYKESIIESDNNSRLLMEENDNKELVEERALKISALIKRNAFLEARYSQKQRKPIIYRGDLMKTMKLYNELKGNSSKNSEKLKGGFGTYCFLKLNEVRSTKNNSTKPMKANTRTNRNEMKQISSFKNYIKAKLCR